MSVSTFNSAGWDNGLIRKLFSQIINPRTDHHQNTTFFLFGSILNFRYLTQRSCWAVERSSRDYKIQTTEQREVREVWSSAEGLHSTSLATEMASCHEIEDSNILRAEQRKTMIVYECLAPLRKEPSFTAVISKVKLRGKNHFPFNLQNVFSTFYRQSDIEMRITTFSTLTLKRGNSNLIFPVFDWSHTDLFSTATSGGQLLSFPVQKQGAQPDTQHRQQRPWVRERLGVL